MAERVDFVSRASYAKGADKSSLARGGRSLRYRMVGANWVAVRALRLAAASLPRCFAREAVSLGEFKSGDTPGTIWAAALMLEHLGEQVAHDRIVAAIEHVLAAGEVRTPDLDGEATCRELATAIGKAL